MIEKSGAEIINEVELVNEIPELNLWEPTDDQIFMLFDNDIVKARYDKFFGLREDSKLGMFVINKHHYRDRMYDICRVINYYESFFDIDHKLFTSTMNVKFIIDQKPNMSIRSFQKFVLDDIITDEFISKIKSMTDYLYRINIDTDEEGKFKNTPKITNIQAKLIVAISFAICCILPLCVHFSDTNKNFIDKKDYIKCFDKIIMKIIKRFEENDVPVFNALCKFIEYRVERYYNADIGICLKKKQLYGTVEETYLEEVIHEVILVKSLYKLEYNRSVVSFIDGVIFKYHYNFKIENFKFKPVEIDPNDQVNDDDDRVSHAESIEMSVYRIDESNEIINEVNTDYVMKSIKKRFNIKISEDELLFYYTHMRLSEITHSFLESFYNRFFHDPNAMYGLSDEEEVLLTIYMKKYLQYKGMILIPQICTANVRGKYRENTIKSAKFIEMITTSDAWKNIIAKRYTYIGELDPKEHPIIKTLSSYINSTLEFIDYDDRINGIVYDDIRQDILIDEFSLFLTII